MRLEIQLEFSISLELVNTTLAKTLRKTPTQHGSLDLPSGKTRKR